MTKEAASVTWRVTWQTCIVAGTFLGGYAVLYGHTLFTTPEQVQKTMQEGFLTIEPRLQAVESHARDQNLHFAFNERSQFPSKDDFRQLRDEIYRLNERLDRISK